MDSARGQVQQMNYTATFPLLLNIADQPSYFMALKDAAGLVKMYAMVNVSRRRPACGLRKQGRAGKHTAHPKRAPEKPCKCRRFPGLFFHALPPLAAHICPLLLPQGSPGTGWGAVPLPPVREKSPAAHRARPGFRDTFHAQRPFQHRIEGQYCRTKVAAICPVQHFPSI